MLCGFKTNVSGSPGSLLLSGRTIKGFYQAQTVNSLMEDTPNTTPSDDSAQEDQPKRTVGRPKKGSITRVYDRKTGDHAIVPTEKLSSKSDLKEVIKHVNKQSRALSVLAINQENTHKFYADLRRKREINLVQVVVEARKGMSKTSIARLLGFEPCMYSQRKDLEEAFEIGRAELESEVLERQLELMRTTKGPILPIFLGKNYAGQKDTPDTQVNVQVNVGEESKTKLADRFLSKSADIAKLGTIIVDTPVPVIEAEFSEVVATPPTEAE